MMKTCPHCQSAAAEEASFCPTCGQPFRARLEKIPFENWRTEGFWRTLGLTWKYACTDPAAFFPLVGQTADTWAAVWFFFAVSVIGFLAYFLLALPLRVYQLLLLVSTMGQQYGNALAHLTGAAMVIFTVISLIITPFFILGWFYLSAWGWQIALMIVKGAPQGFHTTLRVLAYASAPNLVPCVGWIWSLILKIMGLATAHRTELWRPIAAYLINLFFLLICVGLIAGMVILLFLFLVPGLTH